MKFYKTCSSIQKEDKHKTRIKRNLIINYANIKSWIDRDKIMRYCQINAMIQVRLYTALGQKYNIILVKTERKSNDFTILCTCVCGNIDSDSGAEKS